MRPTDFRETRIHFGKNRGLMLSELTPQQVHWYESDWMPKKEVNGPTSVEDLALIQALKAYRSWRGVPQQNAAPARGKQSRRRVRATVPPIQTKISPPFCQHPPGWRNGGVRFPGGLCTGREFIFELQAVMRRP